MRSPTERKRPLTLSDLITQTFFAEGERQEETGIYSETKQVRIRSLDRVPRRRWPMMIVFCFVAVCAGAGAWWLGIRPPADWQRAPAWRALHIPAMPAPAHPRWRS